MLSDLLDKLAAKRVGPEDVAVNLARFIDVEMGVPHDAREVSAALTMFLAQAMVYVIAMSTRDRAGYDAGVAVVMKALTGADDSVYRPVNGGVQ